MISVNKKYVLWFIFTITLFALILFAHVLVLSTLIGIGIAVLLSPLLDFMSEKIKLPRIVGALIALLLFLGLIGAISFSMGAIITEQINAFLIDFPNLSEKIQIQVAKFIDEVPWLVEKLKEINISEIIRNSASTLFVGAQSGLFILGGLAFAFLLGLYLSIGSTFYFHGLVKLFNKEQQDRARMILKNSAKVLRTWFKAQLIDMLIIGLITTISLWALGIDYWALYGLLTGLMGIIPYVGILIVVSFASIVTLASDPTMVPWVILVFLITQQIEGNIILPIVMKGQAEIPEALLIIIMLFFGFWFGFLGLLIAPPVLAIMIYLFREFNQSQS
jgi:predicted PurR-regulated permease PerM